MWQLHPIFILLLINVAQIVLKQVNKHRYLYTDMYNSNGASEKCYYDDNLRELRCVIPVKVQQYIYRREVKIMRGKTDWWITMYDSVERKQITKYFESEFELDKFKRRLKYLTRYTVLESSTDKYWSD